MKVKGVHLSWKVLCADTNTKEIIDYEIFRSDFIIRLHKAVRKKEVVDYEGLRRFIRSEFMYHYWCKSEYEIVVGSLNACFRETPEEIRNNLYKIDAWRQIEMNLDRITEYVNTECRLKFERR